MARPRRKAGPRRLGAGGLAALALALAAASAGWAQTGLDKTQALETGVFQARINSYGFSDGPDEGSKVLIRGGEIWPVVGYSRKEDGQSYFLLRVDGHRVRRAGLGWTPLTQEELEAKEDEPVMVFANPVEDRSSRENPVWVAASDIRLQGKIQKSRTFSGVVWSLARYATREPMTLWIKGSAGFYRPGKNSAFLRESHQALAASRLDLATQARLLTGLVRPGDGEQEVLWAYGQPQAKDISQVGDKEVALWKYPGLELTFENQSLIRVR